MNLNAPYAKYSPSEAYLMRRNLGLSANARAGAVSAGLGGWGDAFTALATSAIGYKVADLQQRRAAAEARLTAAQAAASTYAPPIPQAPMRQRIPMVPLALGAVALLGAGFFLLRKHR